MEFDRHPPPPSDRPDCPHCAAARSGQCTGLSDAACLGCIAREIAVSPAAWRAVRGITAVDLRNAICRHWPGRAYEDGRRAVWAWCKALNII